MSMFQGRINQGPGKGAAIGAGLLTLLSGLLQGRAQKKDREREQEREDELRKQQILRQDQLFKRQESLNAIDRAISAGVDPTTVAFPETLEAPGGEKLPSTTPPDAESVLTKAVPTLRSETAGRIRKQQESQNDVKTLKELQRLKDTRHQYDVKTLKELQRLKDTRHQLQIEGLRLRNQMNAAVDAANPDMSSRAKRIQKVIGVTGPLGTQASVLLGQLGGFNAVAQNPDLMAQWNEGVQQFEIQENDRKLTQKKKDFQQRFLTQFVDTFTQEGIATQDRIAQWEQSSARREMEAEVVIADNTFALMKEIEKSMSRLEKMSDIIRPGIFGNFQNMANQFEKFGNLSAAKELAALALLLERMNSPERHALYGGALNAAELNFSNAQFPSITQAIPIIKAKLSKFRPIIEEKKSILIQGIIRGDQSVRQGRILDISFIRNLRDGGIIDNETFSIISDQVGKKGTSRLDDLLP